MAIDTNIALVSLADAKAFLKILDSTQDTIVGDIVNGVSDWVNRYCNRFFLSKSYTEYYDGESCGELQLKNFPVSALTSLNDDVTRVWAAATAIDVSADVILDGGPGLVRLWNTKSAFSEGTLNVKVVYTAGYLVAAMPYAVQLACKELTGLVYRNHYSQWRLGIASEQIGDRNITFRDEEMPTVIKSMLAPYKMLVGGRP